MFSLRLLALKFFPQVCLNCDRYAPFLCQQCRDELDFLFFQPRFSLLENVVEKIFILGFFTPPLSTLIKALKYQSLWPIGKLLGNLLYQHLQLPPKLDYATAIPLHAKRRQERGYNQAELIARQLAAKLNVPYRELLIRQYHTQNLASTASSDERFKLIQDVFKINPKYVTLIKGKKVLLVDDVVTTGSTLAAAAKKLKTAGSAVVFPVAVAHEG